MAFADDLLRDAHHLANRGGKKPTQSSLRRSVSTAYYALFHLLIADFIANWPVREQRPKLARMFEHRKMRAAEVQLADKKSPSPVEVKLQEVAKAFAQLQDDRYSADYDLGRNWSRTDVNETLARAEDAFAAWRAIRKETAAQNHLILMFGAKR